MPFYEFDQNNSGGSFHYDEKDGISHFVIIEARDLPSAVDKAESIGIYFNGVEDGMDCGCCGNRWSEPRYDEGLEAPEVYGNPVESKITYQWMKGYEAFVHYADGTVKGYHNGK